MRSTGQKLATRNRDRQIDIETHTHTRACARTHTHTHTHNRLRSAELCNEVILSVQIVSSKMIYLNSRYGPVKNCRVFFSSKNKTFPQMSMFYSERLMLDASVSSNWSISCPELGQILVICEDSFI